MHIADRDYLGSPPEVVYVVAAIREYIAHYFGIAD